MINNDTAKSTYTVTEGVTEYPIGFQYTTNPDGTPNLYVWYGDDTELEYGTDYTLSADGLSIELLSTVETGATLNVAVDEPFIQDSDYVVGRIDPEQIEKDFDKSVLRDLELRDYADDINDRFDDVEDIMATYGDIVTHNVSEFVLKTGDTMSGALRFGNATSYGFIESLGGDSLYFGGEIAGVRKYLFHTDTYYNGLVPMNDNQQNLGGPALKWKNVYATKINNGADLSIPITGGTLARVEDIPTTAAEVHALPDTTKYAASIRLSIDPSTFVVTAQLKDQDNNNIGTAQLIDLPLESVVVSGAYDSATREVVLTLEGGSTIRFSVADLVSGLQTEITSQNKLDADLVDDSTSTNKFVTTAEKTTWNSALQSGDDVSELVNDAGYLTNADVAADYVAKTGDRMTGVLEIKRPVTSEDMSPTCVKFTNNIGGTPVELSVYNAGDLGLSGGLISGTILSNMHNTYDIGATYNKWRILYVTKINNGADIAVPASGGTMARVEDLPSVMTGADGTNAGTSGLVPAPAATDNDKFLSGDGTWKTAGGGATYTAGAGISIDANNEISVTDPVLVNNSTSGTARLAVGDGATAGQNTAQAFGTSAHANSNGSLAVGYGAQAQGNYSTAISGATSAVRAIQLGYNGLNSDANTFKVANANGNFEIMSADGTIPEARLADTTNAAQGQVLTLDSNLNAVWQAGGGGSSYTAGTGIDITNNAIGVTDPVLINSSYNIGTDNITIGGTAAQVYNGYSINIGGGSEANGYFAVALGNSATAKGSGSIAIGAGATAGANALTNRAITIGNNICTGDHSTLIGSTTSNTYTLSDSDTFAFANNNGMFKLVDANGNIPTARLTKVNTTVTLAAADWSSNTQTVSVTGMTADGVVFVNPTPANQSAYTSAGILCTAQAAGSLTFTCDTVPSADITVTVVML